MDYQSFCSSDMVQSPNNSIIYIIIEDFAQIYNDIFLNALPYADPILVLVNIYIIFILTRKVLRTPYNIIFIFMALDQGLTILGRYLLFSATTPDFGCSFIYKLPWQLFEIAINNSCSILTAHVSWLAVIITFVRLKQLYSTHLMEPSVRYMLLLSCGSFALLLVASVPFFLDYEIYMVEMSCDSEELETFALVTGSNRIYAHDCLLLRISVFSSGVLFNALPCVLLVFLSSALVFRLRKILNNRSVRIAGRSSSTRAEFVRSSLMIAMIVCTTLITDIPEDSFIITLVTIASACNLVINLCMSKQFREATKKYLCCVCRYRKNQSTMLRGRPPILPQY